MFAGCFDEDRRDRLRDALAPRWTECGGAVAPRAAGWGARGRGGGVGGGGRGGLGGGGGGVAGAGGGGGRRRGGGGGGAGGGGGRGRRAGGARGRDDSQRAPQPCDG